MKKFEEIINQLTEENPEALLADGFEEALIGMARRTGQPTLAVYDVSKCIKILEKKHKLTEDEAWEYFDFNVAGSWMGEHTPVFFDNLRGF
jgi:hypothetical protein